MGALTQRGQGLSGGARIQRLPGHANTLSRIPGAIRHHRGMIHLPLMLLLTLSLACGASDSNTLPTDIAAPAETDAADTAEAMDSATTDSVVTDTILADATVADAADTAAVDTSHCNPLDDPQAIKCDGIWRQVRFWSDWGNASCPTWWTHGTDSYGTIEALAADLACDAGCVFVAYQAVTVLDCDGHRTGYEVYRGPDGCGDPVFGTPIGLLEDLCDWPALACNCEE